MAPPVVSVIIVSYRCAAALGQTLQHLVPQRVAGGMEIIVVDNDSGDGTADTARGFEEVTLIEAGANLGYSAGNNLGFKHASGDYIFILNPDVFLPGDIIQSLIDELEKRPEAGAIGPRIVDGNGALSRFCARRLLLIPVIVAELAGLESTFIGRIARRGYFYPYDFYDKGPVRVPALSGCCMMLRREAFEAVGGFDERFFLFAEDVDLCAWLGEAGWEVVYAPLGPAVHLEGQSMGVGNPKVAAAGADSLLYYAEKHYSKRVLGMLWIWYRITLRMRYAAASFFGLFSAKWRAKRGLCREVIDLVKRMAD